MADVAATGHEASSSVSGTEVAVDRTRAAASPQGGRVGFAVVQQLRSHGPHCVGCGEDNPASLGLAFAIDDDHRVHASMRLDERHQGAPGFAHGGIIATALDDTLGTVLYTLKRPAVTARLTVEYRRPMFIHTDYAIVAWCGGVDGRKLDLRGEIRTGDGEVVAEAQGLFIEVAIEHFAQNGNEMPEHIRTAWRKQQAELPY